MKPCDRNETINRRDFIATAAVAATGSIAFGAANSDEPLRAGAAAVDITPREFPVLINGGFLERQTGKAHSPIHARCLVLENADRRVAIVVVDNCLMPRDLLDQAKAAAEKATGIAADRILIAANHCHSTPSVVGALGSRADEAYTRFLPRRIAEGIRQAAENLRPVRAGWAVRKVAQHTHCRRWILRPDRIGTDPFGGRTVRAMMHPGYRNPSYVGPAGPVDDALTLLSLQTPDGRPVAVLANYSMHYFGAPAVSPDYYGPFAEKLARRIAPDAADPPVAMMSQGTSGDLHWMDYSKPQKPANLDTYAEAMAREAYQAYKMIEYHDRVPLAMVEKKLRLRRRVPDRERLEWARKIIAEMDGPVAKNRQQVYALEQIHLHEDPVCELKLQAIRIGELGIVAMPCEVYGITGLKIKAQSPLVPAMNFELANGAEGYIPPPEQHALGGYTTWEARSAALEVQAEPKIVEAMVKLLEEIAGRPRRKVVREQGPYARAVLDSKPAAYWRLDEMADRRAVDVGGNQRHGEYEDGVAFYLEGPGASGFCGEGRTARGAHFAGGRMKASVKDLGGTYSVEFWFYNGMPVDARPVTGYLFSRGPDGAADAPGDHLGIGGTSVAAGRLLFFNGNAADEVLTGTTEIPLRTWHHVVLVRDGRNVSVYLNGRAAAEISGEAAATVPLKTGELFFGGRNDNFANFEGKLTEVAVYERALSTAEIGAHYKAAGGLESRLGKRQGSP